MVHPSFKRLLATPVAIALAFLTPIQRVLAESRIATLRPAFTRSLVLAIFTVAACAPAPAPAGTGDTASPVASAAILDCTQDGYPCAIADVEPAVWQRSAELGAEAARQLGAGTSPADIAKWLADQGGIAVVEHDDHGLRFRVEGGRFVWVADEPEAGATGATDEAPAAGRLSGQAPGSFMTDRSAIFASVLHSIVGNGEETKSATVIAPMAYRNPSLGASEIATILGQTRGYEGRVSYAEQATRDAGKAFPAFSSLDGHDVVFIRSFGGSVCASLQDEAPIPCHGWIAISEMLGDDLRVPPEQRGAYELVFFKAGGFPYLAAGPDFFRTRYPGGLQDALIVLDVADIDDPALIGAIKGGSSELFGWDGPRLSENSAPAMETFIGDLSHTGRTAKVVYAEHELELKSDGASLFRVPPGDGGSLRIRDILSIRHPEAKDPLATGDEVNVTGNLGDGQPDTVHFVIDIDGITEAEASRTMVLVRIDGIDAEALIPANGGEVLDESSWRLEGDVELPDLTEGHDLDILAKALLPEGGVTEQEVVVKVVQELGSEYLGEFTAVSESLLPGVTTRVSATVTFVREPSELGDTKIKFAPSAGEFHWEYGGTSGNCTYQADPVTLSIDPDDGELRFNLTRKAEGIITYWGDAHVADGPEVKLSIDCKDSDTVTTTRAQGTYFLAPQDEGFLFEGGTITGRWKRDSAIGTVYSWTFTRVR